jgi:predicted RNase H-like HicB family nuclease
MKYRVLIEQDEDGVFVAEVPSLPGCITQGVSRAEALCNVQEAIEGYLESLQAHGEPIPPPIEEEVVDVAVRVSCPVSRARRQSVLLGGSDTRLTVSGEATSSCDMPNVPIDVSSFQTIRSLPRAPSAHSFARPGSQLTNSVELCSDRPTRLLRQAADAASEQQQRQGSGAFSGRSGG